MSIGTKLVAAISASAAILIAGIGTAAATTVPAAGQVAGSGSSAGSSKFADTGSTGTTGDPLALLVCMFTGGTYITGQASHVGEAIPYGCHGGLLGRAEH
ncbi:hypothetical protein [Nocardia sp. NPDC057668]|uniref:hypothetical protein n=1 Tax=Nocardia sp. NPDC057668 TaxID=3346202 RepID=UPI00366D4015